MAGYTATERVHPASVRPRRAAQRPARAPASAAPSGEGDVGPPVQDPDHTPGGLLEDVRAAWAQATFYLFSPDSWR